MTSASTSDWPELPLSDWRPTYTTLHMWAQIVGKTRLALAPMENHWWQVALYVNARGLTTSPMPVPGGNRSLEIEFDFIAHQLVIQMDDGIQRSLPLTSMTVADFFAGYMNTLHELEINPAIYRSPVEIEKAIPFQLDREHGTYNAKAAHQCWRILLDTHRVMKRFRGRFTGKQSPVHFFWGSFDLASTRFSGRRAPRHPGGVPHCPDRVMVEAYSHECSSCGFWPGGGAIDAPAFYAYTYPQPPGYAATVVGPEAAYYDEKAGEFILPYEAVRLADDPEAMLMTFLQSTYVAAADHARWDRSALDRPETVWS